MLGISHSSKDRVERRQSEVELNYLTAQRDHEAAEEAYVNGSS